MRYEYAINRSDNSELYRRIPKRRKFQYNYVGHDAWYIKGWQNAHDDNWNDWCTADRVRTLPDSAVLLAGLMDD